MRKAITIIVIIFSLIGFDGLRTIRLPGTYTAEAGAEEYFKYQSGTSTRYVPHSGGDEIVVWNN